MSLNPGEQIDPALLAERYLPRDSAGEIIPQPEYAILHSLNARELDRNETGFTIEGPPKLLPVQFDTVQGDPYFWALKDNGDWRPVSIFRLSGITHVGRLAVSKGHVLPMLAFKYSNGGAETAERVVAAEVFGEGVLYPGHEGQRRSPYIVGTDIARRDPASSEITDLVLGAKAIKHFAMSCIDPGDNPTWHV